LFGNVLSSTLLLGPADAEAALVSDVWGAGLLKTAVAGAGGGVTVPVVLPPGGLTDILMMNMIAKATATAASVIKGLRCFTAPPLPDGYAYWG
jgi:hypothetical protein